MPPVGHPGRPALRDGADPAGSRASKWTCITTKSATPASARSASSSTRWSSMADKLLMHKYIVKNTAAQNGYTATFMPKPIFQDNGSGMHTSVSMWKGGTNIFYDEKGYGSLSETALYYIGGILKHAPRPAGLRRGLHQLLPPPGPRLRSADQPGLLGPQPLAPPSASRSPAAPSPSASSSAPRTRRPTRTCCSRRW